MYLVPIILAPGVADPFSAVFDHDLRGSYPRSLDRGTVSRPGAVTERSYS